MTTGNSTEKEKRTMGIHFFYVVLILSLIIILLATKKWTTIERFTDYLTAAGTISSLILGTLAIIYSFISSRQQSDALGSIESSGKSIREVAVKMASVTSSAEAIQAKAESRTETMLDLVTQLKSSISSLQENTQELTSKSADIADKVLGVQSQIEAISRPSEAPLSEKVIWNKDTLSDALETVSLTGLCAASLVVKAFGAQEKTLNLTKYTEITESQNFNYLQGFLVGWDSAFIFELEPTKIAEAVGYKVLAVNPELIELLDAQWEQRFKGANERQTLRWKGFKNAIDLSVF
ncbi:hypothetical protein [Variovorax boronicumulans]|uniref:hypothetical protein n=1 Tax=Variovorax boronicumulans TaxID=436515 RepID=UPI0012E47FA0|nr:hypothetical protein [Variovorax boronicumulans]GER16999.1 hypothetical protein VCH24_20120 [Variovorax boronicumulans]